MAARRTLGSHCRKPGQDKMKPLIALWIMLTFGTMILLLALPPPLLEGDGSVPYAGASSRTYGWPHGWLTREEANKVSGRGVHTIRWYICAQDRFVTAVTVSVLGPGLLIMPMILVTRKRDSLLGDRLEP